MVEKRLVSLLGRAETLARSIEPLLDQMLANAWISYAIICALQIKVLWGIWRFRDLTTGDTSSYFATAYRWYEDFEVNIVWSPLYTAFYGTVYLLTHDVYTATILHRVIIVMAATLGILALTRQLLPPAIALLIAAWWAVLPINFETLYEVHLFALLPILAAWLVTTVNDTPWTRGIALAILIATTVLVRNEQIVAVIIFAVICAVRELRHRQSNGEMRVTFLRSRLASYGLPFIASILLSSFFYWRSYVKYPQIMAAIDAKHAGNMCQVYAFGYSQRHPEWALSPWVECQSLLQTVFGRGLPTLVQMMFSNPSAILNHFLWNASLTFNGVQAALFNRMSGRVNPDYAPTITNVAMALVLSTMVLAIVIAGSVKVAREWKYWWSAWLSARCATFLIMLSELLVSVPVILTQRPRPSYLFPTTVTMMVIIGLAVFVLLGFKRLIIAKTLAAMIVPSLLIIVPPYYVKYKSQRPLYTNFLRLQQFGSLMDNSKNRILLGDYNGEYRGYLHFTAGHLTSFDYSILSEWHAPQTLDQFLASRGINMIFIQPRVMPELKARPEARRLLENPQSVGWRKLAPQDGETDWLLLYREPQA